MTASLKFGIALTLALAASHAFAKVAPEKAAELDGPRLTCMGAERAGSAAGVAAFTGKFLGKWPGVTHDSGYEPGPYASEKPLFVIAAQNAAQYAANLTAGQQELLRSAPQNYRIPVFQSHRDFRFEDRACTIARKNAQSSEVVHDGKGVTGIAGAPPFPIPQSGLEAIWNVAMARRARSESVIADTAIVYPSGSIAWGKNKLIDMSPQMDLSKDASFQDKVAAYFYVAYLAPERDRGRVDVGYAPMDFSNDSTRSWEYMPGTRRVRQAPEVGFDYPVPPAGMHVSDEDSLYNGSPERYEWTLIGKKEIYVPYHNFRINDPAVKYAELLKPHSINPDFERYELHRVWVIEGKLRPGLRHVYGRRIIYADEDTWLPLWADHYDTRGELWRASFANWFYSQESSTFHRGVTLYHDLKSGAYEATYLVNEAGSGWWRLNQKFPLSMFTPESAARGGH